MLFSSFLISTLTGCNQIDQNKKKELKILTESSYQAKVEDAASYMMQKNPQLKVKIEYIPVDEEKRENQIQKLRTQIMAGKGADVYLLDSASDDCSSTTTPLLENPYKTMQSGAFADLSRYMKKDDYWKKGTYKKELLEVGQDDGRQYIIPLSCDYEILISEQNDIEYLKSKTLEQWLEEAKTTENMFLKKIMLGRDLVGGKWMKMPIDYEKQQISFDTEQWQQFFFNQMLFKREEFSQVGYGSVGTFMNITPATKAITVVPDLAGRKLASVQAFGAVGMSSDYKKEAYEFLMLFLNDEVKTEREKNGDGSTLNGCFDFEVPVQDNAFLYFDPGVELTETTKQCIIESFHELEGAYFITEVERFLATEVMKASERFDDPNADLEEWKEKAQKLAEQAYQKYHMQVSE